MGKLAEYAFVAGTLSTFLALVGYVFYALSGVRAARMAAAGVPMTTAGIGFTSGPRTASIGHYASLLGWLSLSAIAASLVFCRSAKFTMAIRSVCSRVRHSST